CSSFVPCYAWTISRGLRSARQIRQQRWRLRQLTQLGENVRAVLRAPVRDELLAIEQLDALLQARSLQPTGARSASHIADPALSIPPNCRAAQIGSTSHLP